MAKSRKSATQQGHKHPQLNAETLGSAEIREEERGETDSWGARRVFRAGKTVYMIP